MQCLTIDTRGGGRDTNEHGVDRWQHGCACSHWFSFLGFFSVCIIWIYNREELLLIQNSWWVAVWCLIALQFDRWYCQWFWSRFLWFEHSMRAEVQHSSAVTNHPPCSCWLPLQQDRHFMLISGRTFVIAVQTSSLSPGLMDMWWCCLWVCSFWNGV